MLFTRSRVYVTSLVPICIDVQGTDSDQEFVVKTLQKLWFYLRLPSAALGNICGSPYSCDCLRFISGSAAGIGRVEHATANEIGATKLKVRIERPVRIVRQATYMYNCLYNDAGAKRTAVLKLTWTPTYWLSEGAAYQIIGGACSDKIPKIYSSGILVPDSFGYRLEIAIMEDCGKTLEEYANRCRKSYGNEYAIYNAKMVEVVECVSNCLAIANSAEAQH
ncbi:hypothetical protein H4R20_002365 [Coemansia guatemalensis]|uniref:Uncharacterized protein n=1 Tax=Coemansia guatemalensis TaxID=2761395 RepID=A0A9W8HXS1_9FUNG|nr:hypothetical protein H4R20_002365 [Coemansia guatemalensis]